MFLKTIGDAQLLDTNELFVLKDAPDDTCLHLASTMVKYLLADPANEEKSCLTEEHVEWVMQILGRAFRLPIQQKSEKVISGAIALYRKWMHLPTAPKPIQKKSLYFTKKMCCHLSFVFENRNISANSSEFQVHVSLCQRVLGIYSKSARTPPPQISEISWNEFLCRIFLGICDEVMRGPADSRSLGNDIEQDVFFCMFDIWLRSQMQNETLWQTLLSMASKEWIHRRWFIESWGQCCVALTRKLIHVLYGGDNGADAVFVFWPVLGTNVISINAMLEGRGSMIATSKYKNTGDKADNNQYEIGLSRFRNSGDESKMNGHSSMVSDMNTNGKGPLSMATYISIEDNRLLIYLWNCMLHLLDINAINDPECFGCGIAWISRMVDMFLSINITCVQRRSGVLSANGNSILDIFSHELFTAAVNMNGFEEARAIALGGLCRIFVNKCDTQFKSEYLLNFYHTLHELLRNPNSIEETAREQVILNGATLFACDFDGCRALITIFLPHIGIILRKPQKPRLRLAAITMLCSMISLEWHFNADHTNKEKRGKFAVKNTKKEQGQQLPKLRERLKLIANIIYDAIQTETNEYNLQKLLWSCSVFLIISSKYISKTSPFSSSLVRTIWKHIEEEAGHWPCHVITTAFKALTHVIEHVVYLDNLRNDSVLNWRMFIEMCQYAKIHLEPGTQFDIDSRRVLSVACMKCLLIWLKNDSSLIVSNAQVSKALRGLIGHALKIKANHGQFLGSHHMDSSNGGGPTIPHNTDYDYSGNEPPPLWDAAMTFKGNRVTTDSTKNELKKVYRATDQLARFFTNDLGSYYQYRKQSICNSPIHRYAEASVNEQQIEDHIWKSLHGYNLSDKWQACDRIRYFSYKKNRIITLIEMPRLPNQNQNNQNQTKHRQSIDISKIQKKESAPAKLVSGSQRQRHYLQHLEPRHCDVIVLIRDAYGKYAWEASGIFNDFDSEKEIAEMAQNTPNIIDNSQIVSKGERNTFGSMRQDMIARSAQKSQILAQQIGFHQNTAESKTQNSNDTPNELKMEKKQSYSALVKTQLIEKNESKSSAAYWSAKYIESNWKHRQEMHRQTKINKSAIASQMSNERKLTQLYAAYQSHPLKHTGYDKSQKSEETLDKSVPFSDQITLFSESKSHALPIQDDAATYMHSRRLLSTLGFLRPNRASGVPRFIDILDSKDGELTDLLTELDEITALDHIAISILYHSDSEKQLSDFDILKNTAKKHSQSLEYFLTSMANRVSIETHVGFKANLTGKDCDKFRYYSDSISGELAYIIPSELKANLSFERKKALYLSSCIRIIWSETGKESKNAPIWLSQQYIPTQRHSLENTPLIYIRITAQSHGLYRININGESVLPHLLGQYKKGPTSRDKHHRKGGRSKHTKQKMKFNKSKQIISKIGAAHTNTTSIPTTGFERVIIGPLVDGMIISESVLPDLVRKTIVNASNLISELMDDSLCVAAKQQREKLILEIATRFEKYRSLHRDKYYRWFFINPDSNEHSGAAANQK